MSNPFETTVDESYNPFSATTDYESNNNTLGAEPIEQTNYDYPQSSTPAADSSNAPALKDRVTGLKLSEREIAEREAVLQKKEAAIAARERQVEDARANGTLESLNPHKRNFPILIHAYKYYPEEDLPSDSLKLMNTIKWLVQIGAIILAFNLLCTLFLLAPGQAEKISKGACILFAAIYLLVVAPLSLELGMFPLYNALRDSKGLKFFGSIAFFAIYALFFIYLVVGLGDYGSAGWITSINAFGAEKNKWVGVALLIFSIAGTLFCVFACYVWWILVSYFRANDFSKKAAGEAAGMAANYANDHKEEIAQAAKENPELAMQAAQLATGSGTYT